METHTSPMISLNGTNYQLWKTRMEDLLYVNGYNEPIFCSEKPYGKTNEEWNLFHRRVCGYIRQWVDDTVLHHVSEEINARTLWSKLAKLYAPTTCNGKLVLIKQLMSLRYHDQTAMVDHLNMFQGTINQLSKLGIKIDDEVQGLWLLGTLPDSWETFRTSLVNSTPDGVISVKLAKDSVLNEETRRKSQGSILPSDAALYTVIKVARDENFHEQIGKHISFDLVDHDKVRSFRIQRKMSFALFKEEVAKELGIPVQCQRFWLWAKRENHTYRPNRPLTPLEEAQPVGLLREVSDKANKAEIKLFLEVEIGQNSQPILPPVKTKVEILLFFKLYDPLKEELRYVGRLCVKGTGKPTDILTKLNELAGFAPNEEIELFEEIRFEPNVWCEHVDKKLTFRASQLEDGDIICFQKKRLQTVNCRYPDVPSFLDYVHSRQVVRFRSLEKPKEDEFSLELSKRNSYDDIVNRVASHLKMNDPSKIRLTSHCHYSQQPKHQPIKYQGIIHLSDVLVQYNKTSDILYYEVLDIPLPELQCLKTLKVTFHRATKDEVVIHTFRLPKQSTVRDVIDDLKTKVELSHKDAELRLLEIFCHKIYKIFALNEKIENINDQYWTLRAEEILEEEKDLGPQDRLISVYHFTKDTSRNENQQVQNFGEPFFLVIREDETLAKVKIRIQKKLRVPDEEFSKWKFAFFSSGHPTPTYLQDSDVVPSHFLQRRDSDHAWEKQLGLEHSDNTSKQSYAANEAAGASAHQSGRGLKRPSGWIMD